MEGCGRKGVTGEGGCRGEVNVEPPACKRKWRNVRQVREQGGGELVPQVGRGK